MGVDVKSARKSADLVVCFPHLDSHGGPRDNDDDDADEGDGDGTAPLLQGQQPPSALGSGGGGIGQLLPLSCGHNAPFSDGERARLVFHLASQGWSLDAYGGP